jgi:hypothetical protein
MVSSGRASRGRLPARDTGQKMTPTANTRRQQRHRQRDRHGSKLALRFHQGLKLVTESTVPHCGQATSNEMRRENVRRAGRGRDTAEKSPT